MKEIFKVLEFTDIRRETLGKYAHIVKLDETSYTWAGGEIPVLMTTRASLRMLKEMHKGLSFKGIKIKRRELI